MPPLSDEEKRKILSSSDFSRFFSQASRVIERALAEEVCFFFFNKFKMDGDRKSLGVLGVFETQFHLEENFTFSMGMF